MKLLTKPELLEVLKGWNDILRSKVTLVACGGTALTLQGIKPTTKDIDLIVPFQNEYSRLTKTLIDASYQGSGNKWVGPGRFEFDLFIGNRVHTTELLDSPADPRVNIYIIRWSHIDLLALNDLDLVISKMFRGLPVDVEDCVALISARGDSFDWLKLLDRYYETSLYDVNPDRMQKNLGALLMALDKKIFNVKKLKERYDEWFR